MKKILIALGGLVLLVILALLIVPMFVSLEDYKPLIAEKAKEATGRDLEIAGDISLSLFPSVAVEVEDVTLSNYEQGEAGNMVSLSKLALELQVLPLLSKRVVIDRFVLEKPVINLEVDAKGNPNWVFEGAAPAASDEAEESVAPDGEDGEGFALSGLSLGDVRIQEGELHFRDFSSQTKEDLQDINLEIALQALDLPLSANGDLVWKEEKISLLLDVSDLDSLMNGGQSALKVSMDANPVHFGFDGSASQAGELALKGALNLDVPSVKGLADWVGVPLERQNEETFERLTLNGDLDLKGQVIALDSLALALDKLTAEGAVKIDASGKKPDLRASLSTGVLDVTPYLPPEESGDKAAGAGESGSGGGEAKSQGWSDEPIDFSGLHAANAEIALQSEGIVIRKITIGKSALDVALKDGKLNANLKELALYDGRAVGSVALDASRNVPTSKIDFDLANVQAEPLLRDSADFEKLSGTANSKVNVTTQGRSQKEMVSNLNGSGSFNFRDGAVKGINIAALIRQTSLEGLQQSFDEAESTDFAELSGTYVIKQGLLTNNDLLMVAPLFRLQGKGTVSMPPQTLDYRIKPKLVGSLEGQGGDVGAKGVAVPLMITGPWSDPKIAPDLESLVKDQVSDPSKVLESVTGGEGGVELPKLPLGGGDDSGDGDSENPLEKPAETLKKLFGN